MYRLNSILVIRIFSSRQLQGPLIGQDYIFAYTFAHPSLHSKNKKFHLAVLLVEKQYDIGFIKIERLMRSSSVGECLRVFSLNQLVTDGQEISQIDSMYTYRERTYLAPKAADERGLILIKIVLFPHSAYLPAHVFKRKHDMH